MCLSRKHLEHAGTVVPEEQDWEALIYCIATLIFISMSQILFQYQWHKIEKPVRQTIFTYSSSKGCTHWAAEQNYCTWCLTKYMHIYCLNEWIPSCHVFWGMKVRSTFARCTGSTNVLRVYSDLPIESTDKTNRVYLVYLEIRFCRKTESAAMWHSATGKV